MYSILHHVSRYFPMPLARAHFPILRVIVRSIYFVLLRTALLRPRTRWAFVQLVSSLMWALDLQVHRSTIVIRSILAILQASSFKFQVSQSEVKIYLKVLYCSISFNSTGTVMRDRVVEILISTAFRIHCDIRLFFDHRSKSEIDRKSTRLNSSHVD